MNSSFIEPHESRSVDNSSPSLQSSSILNPSVSTPDAGESERSGEVNKELRRLNRALRALSACNQALAQAQSERELLQHICDVIVEVGTYRFAWIGYAEMDEEKTVLPVAYAGHEDGYLNEIKVRWSDTDFGRGSVGRAIREKQSCVIADTESDPRFSLWRDAALRRGYAAMIALPLRAAGFCFGALAIYSAQKGSFEASEVELLSEMANNLAFGITALRSQEESRRVTAALREAESKYRQLVEQVPAISYVAEAGAQGRFLYLSPQVKTILGYEPEECVTDPAFWWNHLNPEDHPVALLEDTWQAGVPFRVEYRMRTQAGDEVWLRDEAVIVRDPITGKRLTRGMLVDITERRKAEDARRRAEEDLRDSEERYRAFVKQSSEGIFRIEYDPPVPIELSATEQRKLALANGYMAECNDAMAKMYGRASAEDLIGKPLTSFLFERDLVTRRFMEKFIDEGYRISDEESREVTASGEKKIFRNTMVGMVSGGRWLRTWGITRDVTEQLHLEEQLRNAQQMEAIGRLAGGVAHDFNNILNIIMGHDEILLATAGNDPETREGLEQIRRAADRAALLTQQLLAFSRKQVLQPKVLDLNEAVADVQKMLSRVIGEDIELISKLHPSLSSVKADPGQVEQVLMNLAVNARDAMPRGGKLTMETANVEISAEQGRELELSAGSYVLLKVMDTGQGMDAGTLSHIFEPFFTTKSRGKGTGLGLATVYGIVKQSGGSIRVRSEAGAGSEFSIYLPAASDRPRKVAALRGSDGVVGGTETILIAEDEPDLRELTKLFLESYGYRVLTAASAEQAIRESESFGEQIDLLLTDVIMPGMSGPQLAEKVLGKRPQMKIVYMTGYTDDMVVQHRVLEPGVNLLQKPFTKIDLAVKVRATLDGK
jgi:two-component system, cell cycle sensor histidine kinase and response regulator CckA